MSPLRVELRIKEALEGFFDAGHQTKTDVEKYLAGLPPHRYGGYGGNTPCVDVKGDEGQVIIDGGSGIRVLGYELMKGPCGQGKGEVHLLFTHFHWDHLIGLSFFTPIFIPGNTIHVYAVQPDLPNVFKAVFQKPFFPLELEQLGAKIVYHQLEPRKAVKFNDLTVTPYQLDHPDPCWGYRIEHKGKVFSHCVDTECTRVTREQLGPDLPLYQDVDLMIFDAQYTLMETIEKVNWGHSSAVIGLDIAIREGVKRVLFMHHDPASTDEKISNAEAQARRYYEGQLRSAKKNGLVVHEVDWQFAREGLQIEI